MEPEILIGAEVGQGVQRVDRAVPTVPPLAATQNGRKPAARSWRTAWRSASTSMRQSASAGTVRRLAAPRPSSSAALRIELWPSSVR